MRLIEEDATQNHKYSIRLKATFKNSSKRGWILIDESADIWFLPTRQNKAQLLLSFTLLTWVFTGSVFTSAPPADTMLGETPPNSTEPYRIKTCVLYFHPKDKYKHHIDVTNWSNSSDDRHTNTYIYNRGVSDWPCWRGSVCRCRSAVGCGTPSPRCGPGASSSGWWWRLSPRCSGSPPASIWGSKKKMGVSACFQVERWNSGWNSAPKSLFTIDNTHEWELFRAAAINRLVVNYYIYPHHHGYQSLIILT